MYQLHVVLNLPVALHLPVALNNQSVPETQVFSTPCKPLTCRSRSQSNTVLKSTGVESGNYLDAFRRIHPFDEPESTFLGIPKTIYFPAIDGAKNPGKIRSRTDF